MSVDKEITKKVNFNKGGTGGITPKLNLHREWLTDMGIATESNEVVLKYNSTDKVIIIEKKK